MAEMRGYSAGKLALEIKGQDAGFLTAVEGGEPVATVVPDAPDANGVVRKHLGGITIDPLKLTFDAGMSAPFYEWISGWLSGQAAPMDGAVVFLDFNFREQSRLEFKGALITEVTFSVLDGSSKDPISISLTLQPATAAFTKGVGNAKPALVVKSFNRPRASNFRLSISPLATSRVNRIEALVVSQAAKPAADAGAVLKKRASPTVPDLVFTVAESDAQGYIDRFNLLVAGADPQAELNATIEWLDATVKNALFTLALSNLEIYSIQRLRTEADSEVIARVRVAMYCEQIAFSAAAEAVGVAPDPPPPPPPGRDFAGLLLGLLGGQLSPEAADAIKTLAGPKAGDLTDPGLIARRLNATVEVAPPSPSGLPTRDDGVALGVRWASGTATLAELTQIAALEPRSWSAVSLGPLHSLTALLVSEGLAPAGATDGAVDLQRDDFVEGIVAGTSQVLQLTSPLLLSGGAT
jgi:hypothetical protein